MSLRPLFHPKPMGSTPPWDNFSLPCSGFPLNTSDRRIRHRLEDSAGQLRAATAESGCFPPAPRHAFREIPRRYKVRLRRVACFPNRADFHHLGPLFRQGFQILRVIELESGVFDDPITGASSELGRFKKSSSIFKDQSRVGAFRAIFSRLLRSRNFSATSCARVNASRTR